MAKITVVLAATATALCFAACNNATVPDGGGVCQTTGESCESDASCCPGFLCLDGACVFAANGNSSSSSSSSGQTTSPGGSSSSSGSGSGTGSASGGSSSGGSSSNDCGADTCSQCPPGYVQADSCVSGAWQCACALGSSSSSGSSGRNGSSSGNGSSSSSGGPTCGGVDAACRLPSDCCGGLLCSSGFCVPPATCAAAGTFCTASAQCCPGLTCDLLDDSCGIADAGCAASGTNGGCLTAANCAPPDVCEPAADGGGFCGAVTVAPSAVCVPNGQACSAASGPCCGGSCTGGLCVARGACGVTGQACASAGDCCNDFGCDAGSCQPSCGAELAACSLANGNADCCTAQGLTCVALSAGGTSGVCYFAQYQDATGNPLYCGDPCSALPCALGTTCQLSTGVDPCAAAGFACNQFGVCANPPEGYPCLPGGPACQPLAGSSVTDLQCLPVPAQFGVGSYCVQPCGATDPANGTSDCVDPLMTCVTIGGTTQGSECFYNEGCTTSFGACNSSGVGDGVCVPYNFSNGATGLCYQATLDGGGPGSACEGGGNRQNGGFCDPTSYCDFGVCAANCNAGTGGTPACAQDAGAGTTVACRPIFGQSGDATDFGSCSVACDFTSATGGGCATADGGLPEKCLPPAYLGLPDATTGMCAAAPAAGTATAVGAACTQSPTLVDTCVDGALCLGNGIDVAYTCVQLCTNVGVSGQAPCKADQVCDGLDFGVPSADEGYCGLADGGFGG